MRRPTIDGAAMDLELSQSDKKLIEDPNSVIGKMNQAD
jgi:hypothetical protein